MSENSQTGIYLINKYTNSSDKRFLSFWENIKKKDYKHVDNTDFDFSSEYEKLNGQEMLHLLVKVSAKTKIETIVTGHGMPMLLLSGFGHAAPLWKSQFESFYDSFQLIHMNPPAVGLSEWSNAFTLEEIADCMEQALEELGVNEPIFILASSWGGIIGQIMAQRYPDKVKTVILADCFYELKVSAKNAIALSSQLENDYKILGMEELYKDVNRFEAVDMIAGKGYVKYALTGFNIKEVTEQIKTPALIIHGEKDSIITYENSRELYELIPNAEFTVVEGAGHMPNFTHAQKYNEVVLNYIDELLHNE